MTQLETPSMLSYSYGGVTSGDCISNAFIDPQVLNRRISSWDSLHPEWAKPWEGTTLDTQLAELMIKPKEEDMTNKRRLVKVIIVDPNENVPLEDAVLYMGDEELTDLTDTEIFYDLDIKNILNTHNGTRVGIVDKDASKERDKDVYLEKIRIRDLKMVVLTIADF